MSDKKPIFDINNINVTVEEKQVDNGLSLTIQPGERYYGSERFG